MPRNLPLVHRSVMRSSSEKEGRNGFAARDRIGMPSNPDHLGWRRVVSTAVLRTMLREESFRTRDDRALPRRHQTANFEFLVSCSRILSSRRPAKARRSVEVLVVERQPHRAALIAAMSIFFMPIIAS